MEPLMNAILDPSINPELFYSHVNLIDRLNSNANRLAVLEHFADIFGPLSEYEGYAVHGCVDLDGIGVSLKKKGRSRKDSDFAFEQKLNLQFIEDGTFTLRGALYDLCNAPDVCFDSEFETKVASKEDVFAAIAKLESHYDVNDVVFEPYRTTLAP
jgi:hypothetical protein